MSKKRIGKRANSQPASQPADFQFGIVFGLPQMFALNVANKGTSVAQSDRECMYVCVCLHFPFYTLGIIL